MRRLFPYFVILSGACGSDSGSAVDAAVPDAARADAAAVDAASADAAPTAVNACDPAYLPMNRAKPLGCCLKAGDEWFLSGNQSSLGNLVHRQHAKACTADGVTTGCAGMDCKFGPCGAFIVETFAAPAHVFHPLSDPTVCGREATGLPGVPEAFTTQTPYDSVAPACPYTDCVNGGPVVGLKVTTTASAATGRVTSSPAGIDVTGAGSASAQFGVVDITLTAAPTGAHARAVFSGDCAATGAYGASATCSLKLGPDKAVAVAFECEGGFSCSL